MKVTLTTAEIIKALGLPEGTEVAIECLAKQESNNDWVSNVGNDTRDYPDTLNRCDRIEVKYRSGTKSIGRAFDWTSNWRETDKNPGDIVAYRKIS